MAIGSAAPKSVPLAVAGEEVACTRIASVRVNVMLAMDELRWEQMYKYWNPPMDRSY